MAAAYAQQGFIVYTLCYFDCRLAHPSFAKYPPDELINIYLSEVTYRAMAWLNQSPMVKNRSVSLVGYLRGAEQVLFLESALIILKKTRPDILFPKKIVSVSTYQATASGILLWWVQEEKKTRKLPPENFNVPTWKIMGKSYLGGVSINFSETVIPTLITGFSIDPIWGDASLAPYRKKFHPHVQLPLYMSLGEKAADKIALLPKNLWSITF